MLGPLIIIFYANVKYNFETLYFHIKKKYSVVKAERKETSYSSSSELASRDNPCCSSTECHQPS
jgi:hypothetical protein